MTIKLARKITTESQKQLDKAKARLGVMRQGHDRMQAEHAAARLAM